MEESLQKRLNKELLTNPKSTTRKEARYQLMVHLHGPRIRQLAPFSGVRHIGSGPGVRSVDSA